jgi:hypothetical protein
MRDELLNKTLFTVLDDARDKITAWARDYNTWQFHSSLVYSTTAAFAADFKKQGAASLRIAGGYDYAALASPAHIGKKNAEALMKLDDSWGSRQMEGFNWNNVVIDDIVEGNRYPLPK